MVGLTATSIWRSSVRNLDAGAYIAGAWEGGEVIVLHLAFLPRGGGLAVVDAVEITARTIVVVTETTSTIDAHGRIDAVVLASSTLGTGIAGVGDTSTIGGNEVGTAVHCAAADQGLVLVDFLRNVGHSIGICGRLTGPFQHIMIATLVIG